MNAPTGGGPAKDIEVSQNESPRAPTGFAGGYAQDTLWQEQGRTLRLPEQALGDGPFLRVPEGEFTTILVTSLCESFGNLERFLDVLAERLVHGGRLLIDAESAVSLRAVRTALEGRLGAFEPFGSLTEPERRVLPRRLVQALAARALLVRDLIQVPSGGERMGREFVAKCMAEGFLATAYIPEAPTPRLWLLAEKGQIKAGSVLIGAGSRSEQERTTRAVSAFLSDDWEVVPCAEGREAAEFNKALPVARGELLWFLRAGAEPDRELFTNLLARSVLSPAAPGVEQELQCPGDVSGLMLARTDALLNGPIDLRFACETIAYEDWLLRLDARGRSPCGVPGAFATPALPRPAAEALRAEGEVLLARWDAVGRDKTRFESDDDPRAREHKDRAVPWAGRTPRISLVMMVKNEERFLPECLRRAAPCVDEIVVVDTGSTDRTVEIATSFGARIVPCPWSDDFSAPRNVGLEHATGDWVLVLDADEFLHEDAPARIRELVTDAGVSGYHLVFRNVYTGGKTIGVIMVRLFRRLPGIRWVNRIHEQITPALLAEGGKQGMILSISKLEVDHHGYSDEVMDARDKNTRNERLFLAQLAAAPDDLYSLYKYGDFLRRVPGRTADARAWLQKAFDQLLRLPPVAQTEVPYAGEIAALLVLEYAREEAHERADRILEHALRHFVPTPNLHYIAATIALRRNQNDAAIAHFERCLLYRDQVLVVAIQEGITSYVALVGLAQAWLGKGDRAKAIRLLEQARTLKPDYDLAAMTLSRLRLEGGDAGGAIAALTDLLRINPKSAGASQQASILLARLGQKEQAKAIGRHAVALMEQNALAAEARRMKEFLVTLS